MEKVKMAFLSVVVLFSFPSCGASKEADAGASQAAKGEVIEEERADPEIQAPEHPEGLQFVDIVPGEWSVVSSYYLNNSEDLEPSDEIEFNNNSYLIFKEEFVVKAGDAGGIYTGSWSYDEKEYVFQYRKSSGMTLYRYRVLSFENDELELMLLIDHWPPVLKQMVEEGELSTPEIWKRK
ncbi:hypothetical protein [Sediminispirochaeta bajacaliforniensis]|uniref:hypothetical protein n=1 Tax=Sediminispirochaeta bajacaliforniensis TaxID=148 RepID=UPI0003732C62|nr:hypothetical protein [Sediminispirochaeta bajacaliforniensis]